MLILDIYWFHMVSSERQRRPPGKVWQGATELPTSVQQQIIQAASLDPRWWKLGWSKGADLNGWEYHMDIWWYMGEICLIPTCFMALWWHIIQYNLKISQIYKPNEWGPKSWLGPIHSTWGFRLEAISYALWLGLKKLQLLTLKVQVPRHFWAQESVIVNSADNQRNLGSVKPKEFGVCEANFERSETSQSAWSTEPNEMPPDKACLIHSPWFFEIPKHQICLSVFLWTWSIWNLDLPYLPSKCFNSSSLERPWIRTWRSSTGALGILIREKHENILKCSMVGL